MSTDPSSAPAASDALGYLLKHATMRLTALTDAALKPEGIDSKDLGALRVLARREPMSQLRVAQTLGIDRTTMVALLDGLERRGIVTRHPDPEDRRRNLVELTTAGAEIYDAGEAARKAVEIEFLAPIDIASAKHLRRSLRRLVVDSKAD
jgi:DNA-binding MarR family transcriptional regulator